LTTVGIGLCKATLPPMMLAFVFGNFIVRR
jgi:hypothetical protein